MPTQCLISAEGCTLAIVGNAAVKLGVQLCLTYGFHLLLTTDLVVDLLNHMMVLFAI